MVCHLQSFERRIVSEFTNPANIRLAEDILKTSGRRLSFSS